MTPELPGGVVVRDPPAMASNALLSSIEVDGFGSDGAVRVRAVVAEAWGIVFAHGGVVMAVMLRAAELALGRDDLRLSSASATFCRPVPCGPVTMEAKVLRAGRNGAQTQVTLRVDGEVDPAPNAIATVVSTAEAEGWPEITGVDAPDELDDAPEASSVRLGTADTGHAPTGFFAHTDWRPAARQPADPLRRVAWFSFAEPPLLPDGTWVRAMLAVPADALGIALTSVTQAMGPMTAPSLQITVQLFGDARGAWLGLDSRCFHTHGGVAAGVATLWNADGTLVGSATQTAILRTLPG